MLNACITAVVLCLLLHYRRGLEALVDEGLTKSIGVSNASLPQVEEILAAAKHKPVVNQVSSYASWQLFCAPSYCCMPYDPVIQQRVAASAHAGLGWLLVWQCVLACRAAPLFPWIKQMATGSHSAARALQRGGCVGVRAVGAVVAVSPPCKKAHTSPKHAMWGGHILNAARVICLGGCVGAD